jgi:hypothetical protein
MAQQLGIFLVERQRCAVESMKPMETMQWDELRFSGGDSALETGQRT